jgi:UBX domain-containing protein 1/4
MVNQEFVTMLISMGYSKNVSEKSLLFTGNASVEKALEWIDEHKEDADFEEELRVTHTEEKAKLSNEEVAQRAKELQARLREIRKQKDIEEERERERNRVASGKALVDAKRIFEEQEQKRAVESYMKEKSEDEVYKRKLLEELEREKIARFGPDVSPMKSL